MPGRRTIDAFRFARERQALRGKIIFFDLPRLQDSLASATGGAEYCLDGGSDEQGRSILSLQVRASLPLTCWRCLKSMVVEVELATRFVLIAEEAALPAVEDEPEDWTALVGSTPLDVETLVEDELILALPIAPSHAPGECRAAETVDGTALAQEDNPFRALSVLKRKKD